MNLPSVDRAKFTFRQLPALARWILNNRLEEYGIRNLRLSKDLKLPLLQSFLKFSEEELLAMGRDSNRHYLEQVAGDLAQYVEKNLKNWIDDKLEVIAREDVKAEDLALVYSIRRRLFQSFFEEYTSDKEVLAELHDELETYTVNEEILSWTVFINMQQESLASMNRQLKMNEEMLLQAQELGKIGSFLIVPAQPATSVYSPNYYRILEGSQNKDWNEFLKLVHPEDRKTFVKALGKAAEESGEFELEYRYHGGSSEKRIWTRGICGSSGSHLYYKGTLRDITEQHNLFSRLQESERLYREAQALTHIGNWSWSLGDLNLTWSEELLNIFELDRNVTSLSAEVFLAHVHPDDRNLMENYLRSLQEGKFEEEVEYRIVSSSGKIKIVRTLSNADVNSEGKVTRAYGTCQDITREYMLKQQLLAANETLEKRNKDLGLLNEELQSFNYVASHDLQEPLRKIQIYGNRLRETAELPAEAEESVNRMIAASGRMQNLIDDLIQFSQLSVTDQVLEEVDLNVLVREVWGASLDSAQGQDARLEAARLPVVRAVPFQMTQLFTNLITNALKYRNRNVAPLVRISTSSVEGSEIGQEAARRYVAIAISDNGIGFSPEHSETIFELFKRLHSRDQYPGTGIGLAICRKIVQRHDGVITASSMPGKGSTFTIYLPEGRLVS